MLITKEWKTQSKPVARSILKPKQDKNHRCKRLLCHPLKVLKIEYVQKFKLHSERKWKADFYIVAKNILVEVEGSIGRNGRHIRGKGISVI